MYLAQIKIKLTFMKKFNTWFNLSSMGMMFAYSHMAKQEVERPIRWGQMQVLWLLSRLKVLFQGLWIKSLSKFNLRRIMCKSPSRKFTLTRLKICWIQRTRWPSSIKVWITSLPLSEWETSSKSSSSWRNQRAIEPLRKLPAMKDHPEATLSCRSKFHLKPKLQLSALLIWPAVKGSILPK